MNNRIQEITQRHVEITRSPWREYMQTYVDDPESCYRSIEAGLGYYGVELEKAVGFCITGYISPEDATFIANAPEDIAYLLSEIERLQEENKDMKDAIEKIEYEIDNSDMGTAIENIIEIVKG